MAGKFRAVYLLDIEDENIELSEQLYSELVDILGDDDSDLVRAKMQIDYLNEFSIE